MISTAWAADAQGGGGIFSDPTFWGIAAIAGACALRPVPEVAAETAPAVTATTTPATVTP